MTLVLAAAALVAPAAAVAHGDPASERLAEQNVYPLPGEINAPPGMDRLAEEVEAVRRDGYPLKVVVIGHRADVGINTYFWRRPLWYARYVATDVGPLLGGPVLVVMPNGYGVAEWNEQVGEEQRALAKLPAPGERLTERGVEAVRTLAALPGRRQGGGTSTTLLAAVGAGALVALTAGALWLRRRAAR